ncbi:MAG: LUD domain-containing protein [Candidatus Caldarchaeum sp.]
MASLAGFGKLLDVLGLFMERFRILGGYAALAENPESAATVAADFLRQHGSRTVFISKLPTRLTQPVEKKLKEMGLQVYSYDSSEDPVNVVKVVDAGISTAAAAVAETGTLVEVAFDDVERLVSSLPKTYVCFVNGSTVVKSVYMTSGLLRSAMENDKVAVTFISGPSRSGDIEQRLVLGIHGPHHVLAVVCSWL